MIYAILLSCSVLLSLVATFMWRYFTDEKGKIGISDFFKNFKRAQLFFFLSVFALLVLTTILQIMIYKSATLLSIKRLCLISVLIPLALIDRKKFIIPNKILLTAIVYWGIIKIIELITDFKSIKTILFSEIVACVGIVLIFLLLRLAVRGGIGYGDIKLFGVMGLFLGISGTITSVFASLIVSFIISVFLLVTKRKNKKDEIAFGPAIAIGTTVAILIFGA